MLNWIRNIDIRKVAYAVGIMTLVEQGIVSGDAPLTGLMSAAALASLVAWCKLLIWVNGFILIGHTATAVRWPTPAAPGGFNAKALVAFFAVLVLMGAGLPPVHAAAFKAPPPQQFFGNYASGGCGVYYGLNTMGAGGSINGGPVGATQIQGDIGVTLGYGCPIGTTAGSFWFAEGNFDFANINGSQNGLAFTGPAHFEQRLGAGGPISAMINSGLFPNLNLTNGLAVPSLPAFPAGVTAGPSYPFLFVALHEEDISASFAGLSSGHQWLISPGIGIGLQSRLSNQVVAETAAQWVLRSNGLNVGPEHAGFGNGAEVSFTLKY